MNIIVPAYFYPGKEWEQLADRASFLKNRLYAIANIYNGPGNKPDPAYTSAMTTFQNNSGKTYGYVHTKYGQRNIVTIKKEISRWFSFYPIDGIFLDEQSNKIDHIEYYYTLYSYVKSIKKQVLVIGNPGTSTIENYLIDNDRQITDVLTIFENNSNLLNWTPDSWVNKHQNIHFMILTHSTPVSSFSDYIQHAHKNNIGWIFCTNDRLPNPWDILPDYFNDFCKVIKNIH